MKKNIKINFKYAGLFLYSPDNFYIKKNSDFLNNILLNKNKEKQLLNSYKAIFLKFFDIANLSLNFSNDKINEDILKKYDYYFKRPIKVKKNKLVIKDLKDLEKYNKNENKYIINLKSGCYITHIFIIYDNEIYFYFEKVKNFNKYQFYKNNHNGIISTNRKAYIYNLSSSFNNYMTKYYYSNNKEEIDNKFKNINNNFFINVGKLNITSGKIAIVDANNYKNVEDTINNKAYLDKEVPTGKHNIYLSMRKSQYFGTFITGIKIEFSKDDAKNYEPAFIKNTNNSLFTCNSYYGAICDFESLNDYSKVRNALKYINDDENCFLKDYKNSEEKYKNIIDIMNHFMLWNIPLTKKNILIYNIELDITKYGAYYGLDEQGNIVSLYIHLIDYDVFNNETIKINDKNNFINLKISEIKKCLNTYLDSLNQDDKNGIITLPDSVNYKLEKILFEILKNDLEKDFIYKFLKLLDEYENVNLYVFNVLCINAIYNFKELIYESTKNNPTYFKVYLLGRYLYLNGYNRVENKKLFNLLKKLCKSNKNTVSVKAITVYKDLTNRKKSNRNLILSIITIIYSFYIIISVSFPQINYDILEDSKIPNSYSIETTDKKYKLLYKLPNSQYERTRIKKNEDWISLKSENTNIYKMIKIEMKIYNMDKFLKKLRTDRNNLCKTNTKTSKIKCYNIVENNNFELNEIKYNYFTYTFTENDTFTRTVEYLLYELDNEHIIVIYNNTYNIQKEEFENLCKNTISKIMV